MPRRLLASLGRAATPALALGIFAGLLAPPVAHAFRPLLLPSIVLLLALALLRLDWGRMGRYARPPGLVSTAIAWQLLLSPLDIATASCRESVCPYVLLSLAAAPLTKKHPPH